MSELQNTELQNTDLQNTELQFTICEEFKCVREPDNQHNKHAVLVPSKKTKACFSYLDRTYL